MASTVLLKAGIFVGGFIIARIAAKIVSSVSEEEGAETRPRNGIRNPDTRSTEVPKSRSTSTDLPEIRINLESKTATTRIDSGIQHKKKSPPPSSSSETTARRRTLQKTHEVSEKVLVLLPSPPPPPPPSSSSSLSSSPSTSPSPSPTHTVPRQTSGSHKTTAQTLPHDDQPPSSCKPSSLSLEPHWPSSSKPTLSVAPSDPIPEDLKALIKKDVVPGVLKKLLSSSTYKDYFDALLYAEDYYIEKWDGFEMKNVTLALQEAAIYKRKDKHKTGM